VQDRQDRAEARHPSPSPSLSRPFGVCFCGIVRLNRSAWAVAGASR
jgi:hypothetical protein